MKKVMKNKKVIAVMAVVVLAVALFASGVVASPPLFGDDPPVASKINYQGQLTDSAGDPLSGTYDMQFLFYDAASGGSQVGSTITKNNATVTNGLFSVELDVEQSDFNGQGLWLEVKVEGETLSPRQEILPVPYALSLKPGAEIKGDVGTSAALVAENTATDSSAIGIKGWASYDGYVENYGGYFTASGSRGIGVYGLGAEHGGHFESTASTGEAVYAVASGSTSTGVYGESSGPGGTCRGGAFRTSSPGRSSAGVSGGALADGDDVENYGGIFWAMGGEGRGVFGYATNEGDVTNYGGYFVAFGSRGIGVYAEGGPNGYAADFKGNVRIQGDLTVDGPATGFFPRPAYDSGWVQMNPGEDKYLYHNLGGNVDNYVVDMQFRNINGVHNFEYGTENYSGAYYERLNNNRIRIVRGPEDVFSPEIRIRIWVYE